MFKWYHSPSDSLPPNRWKSIPLGRVPPWQWGLKLAGEGEGGVVEKIKKRGVGNKGRIFLKSGH